MDDSSIISKFEAPCWLGDIEQTLPTSQPRRLAGFNHNDITDIPMMKGWVCSLFHRGFCDSSMMIPDITFTYQHGSRCPRPRTRSVLQENSSLTRTDYLITSVTLSSSFIAKTIKHRKLNCSHPTMCVLFLGVDTQKNNRTHPFRVLLSYQWVVHKISGGFPSAHLSTSHFRGLKMTLCPKSLKGKGSSPFANQLLKAVGS